MEQGPQRVPFGDFASEGQVLLDPLQVSATSHAPVSARHTVPAGSTRSTQLPEPLQVSGASHAVLEELPHAVPAAL